MELNQIFVVGKKFFVLGNKSNKKYNFNCL